LLGVNLRRKEGESDEGAGVMYAYVLQRSEDKGRAAVG
jgi:hypothetical protein